MPGPREDEIDPTLSSTSHEASRRVTTTHLPISQRTFFLLFKSFNCTYLKDSKTRMATKTLRIIPQLDMACNYYYYLTVTCMRILSIYNIRVDCLILCYTRA